jgi:hypothetical protein
MAMNRCHRVCCSSHGYLTAVEDTLLPWALADVDLGDNLLVLIDRAPHYTAVEITKR